MKATILTKENVLPILEKAKEQLKNSKTITSFPPNILINNDSNKNMLDKLGVEYKENGNFLHYTIKNDINS